jgi:hypothetical protein
MGIFKHVPVTSETDNTLNWEQLEVILAGLQAGLKKIEEQLATKK